ncbi:LOW QUALITY PROTEIN: uncharacterized protein PRD47_002075 [Ara ararauna]
MEGQRLPGAVNPEHFPGRLWQLVNSPRCGSVRWDARGEGLLIDQRLFERELLGAGPAGEGAAPGGRFFKTRNFASFVRQLNLYGFRKLGPGPLQEPAGGDGGSSAGPLLHFHSPHFRRDRPELLVRLKRLTSANKAKLAAGLELPSRPAQRCQRPPSTLGEAARPGLVTVGQAPQPCRPGSFFPSSNRAASYQSPTALQGTPCQQPPVPSRPRASAVAAVSTDCGFVQASDDGEQLLVLSYEDVFQFFNELSASRGTDLVTPEPAEGCDGELFGAGPAGEGAAPGGRFFKTRNFASFVRQLNLYGFRKLGPGPLQEPAGGDGGSSAGPLLHFHSPHFRRDRPELLVRLKRLTSANKAKLAAGLELPSRPAQRCQRPPSTLGEAVQILLLLDQALLQVAKTPRKVVMFWSFTLFQYILDQPMADAPGPLLHFHSPHFRRDRPELLVRLKRLTSANKAKLAAGLEVPSRPAQRCQRPPSTLGEAARPGADFVAVRSGTAAGGKNPKKSCYPQEPEGGAWKRGCFWRKTSE